MILLLLLMVMTVSSDREHIDSTAEESILMDLPAEVPGNHCVGLVFRITG